MLIKVIKAVEKYFSSLDLRQQYLLFLWLVRFGKANFYLKENPYECQRFSYSAPLFSLWNFSEQTKISHLPCSIILVLNISLKPGINSKKRLPWEYTWLFSIWIRGRSYAQVFIMRKIFLISTQTTVSRLTCSTPLVLYAPLKSGSNSKKVVTMIPLLANWKSYQQLSCVWNDFCVQRFMLNIFFP